MPRTFCHEIYLVFSPGAEVTILINNLSGDEGGVLTLIVYRQTDMVWCSSGANHLFANNLAVLAGYDLHLSGVEDHSPTHVVFRVQSHRRIMHRIAVFCILSRLAAHTLRLAVDEQFYLVGIIIVAPHVDFVARHPVPMGEEVQHRLRCPLALIHVIGVFGETCEVDDAEVAGTSRESVGRRLADVVPSRPDILSSDERIMLHHIPGLFMRRAP